MPKIADTQVMSYLLDENRASYSLKNLAKDILGMPEEEIKTYEEVDKNNLMEFGKYGMNDAIWTYQLYQKLTPEISKQGLSHLFWDIEMPFQYVLTELHINGIMADKEAARQMKYEVQHLYYQIENKLLKYFGGKYIVGIRKQLREVYCKPSINFNSPEQVIPLVESLGFKITEQTKKKKKSFGKITKKRLAGQHPIIDLLIKFGTVQKLLSSFLNPFERFIDVDIRIRCNFHNTVAVTGRLSCSSPNIEQLPQNNDIANIRNLFISADNHLFIVADYKSQELRILGQESNDFNLKRDLKSGKDLHQLTADSMEIDRTEAKTVNFGIPYGKTEFGFAKDWNCSLEDAKKRIDKYFDSYPSVKVRIERCKQQIYRKGFVTNMSGRKRRFPDFHKGNKWEKDRCYRQGFNFLIQSYGADVIKVASTKIIKDKVLKIVNIVHDEIVIECPKYYIEQGIAWVVKCMKEALPIFIPWDVSIGVADRYGEAK